MRYERIFVISDQHFPYNHPDVVPFLKACDSKFKPQKIVNIGDEIDGHSISFHEHIPDLLAPADELATAINRLKPIMNLWPEMDILESNHGSLVYRRGRFAGLPSKVFKSYRDILEAPKGWQWHDDLILRASNGRPIYFCHGLTKDSLKASRSKSMSFVCGHFHSSFEIRYWANGLDLFWSMVVGCLIDHKSLAYSYGKTFLEKPILGCGAIIGGHPQLVPMVVNRHGRWIGKLV